MTISQRIFALLKMKHLSQKDLAEYTGLSPAAISGWKKRNTSPSCDNLLQICDFLGVSVMYLLTGREEQIGGDSILMDVPIPYGTTLTPEFEQGRILGILEHTADALCPKDE